MPRRILNTVYHGSTHSPYHHIRSRLVPGPVQSGYDDQGRRLTSSIHSIINWRAGLHQDRTPVAPRASDIKAPFPYNAERPRRHPQDPRRLP